MDAVTQIVFGTRLDNVATIYFYVSHGLYCQQSLFLYRDSHALRVGGACLMYFYIYVCFPVCICLLCFASCACARCLEAVSVLFLFLSCTTVHSLPWKRCQCILLLYSPSPFVSFVRFPSLSFAHPHPFRCVCQRCVQRALSRRCLL